MTKVLLTGLLALIVAASVTACTKSEEHKGGAPAAAPAPAEKAETPPAAKPGETAPPAAAKPPATPPGAAAKPATPPAGAPGQPAPAQPAPGPDKVQT